MNQDYILKFIQILINWIQQHNNDTVVVMNSGIPEEIFYIRSLLPLVEFSLGCATTADIEIDLIGHQCVVRIPEFQHIADTAFRMRSFVDNSTATAS